MSEHWSVFKRGSCLVQTTSIRTSLLKRANIRFIKFKQKKITTVVLGSLMLWAWIDTDVVLLFLLRLSFVLIRYVICSTHFQTPGGIRKNIPLPVVFSTFFAVLRKCGRHGLLCLIYYVSRQYSLFSVSLAFNLFLIPLQDFNLCMWWRHPLEMGQSPITRHSSPLSFSGFLYYSSLFLYCILSHNSTRGTFCVLKSLY